MKEDTEVGDLVLKRQKQTVFERSYQTSRFMSTDCRDIRAQLLVIDALFSNYLRASEPCAGKACQDNLRRVCCPHSDLPDRMPVLEMSPNVSESLRLRETTELAMCEPECVTSKSSFGKLFWHTSKHALHYADEGKVNKKIRNSFYYFFYDYF